MMKDIADMLRSLPVTAPPDDLSSRVMQALPRHRGFLGRVEYVLKRELTPNFPRKSSGILSSTPDEFGMNTIIAGFFFLLLVLFFVFAIHSSGLDGVLAHALFALSPALLGAVLLIVAGWVQIKSPQAIVQQSVRFAVAGFLFGLSATIGFLSGGHYVANLTAALLGLSGLVMTLCLSLIPKFSLSTREACCERKSCIA